MAVRQLIDRSSKGNFEQKVFHDSYCEFLLQAQTYNPEGKFNTFEELVKNNPKANSLHYKVGFAIGLFVQNLNGQIPGTKDNLGNPLSFSRHKFEIIASDIHHKMAHCIAITYETLQLTLLGVAGEFLILTSDTGHDHTAAPISTFTLKLQENMAITEYQEVAALECDIKFGEPANL